MLKPLDKKALKWIKINGHCLTKMDGVELKPNDRICIGPSAIFLFKNKQNEANASMPDSEEDPISFDFASDEVNNIENAAEREEQEEFKKQQEEEAKRAIAEMQDKLKAELAEEHARFKAYEEELLKMQQDGDSAKAAELEEQLAIEKARAAKAEQDKMKAILGEGMRQKQQQAEYNLIEKQLAKLLPMVNEANLASTELKRDFKFNTKMVKKLDPFGGIGNSKTEILVKVDNNEDKYYYEWPIDKFENRLFMVRELLEEYFDNGVLPKLSKNEDPFWDPPNPILIGQSFLQLEPLGLGFENELEAAILSIDGAGGKQGMLTIGYQPCNDKGQTEEDALPEEIMVDDASELIGYKDLFFKLNVKCAKDLPAQLNCNPFVTY